MCYILAFGFTFIPFGILVYFMGLPIPRLFQRIIGYMGLLYLFLYPSLSLYVYDGIQELHLMGDTFINEQGWDFSDDTKDYMRSFLRILLHEEE